MGTKSRSRRRRKRRRRRRRTSVTDRSAEVSCSSPLRENEAERSSCKIREKEEKRSSSGAINTKNNINLGDERLDESTHTTPEKS